METILVTYDNAEGRRARKTFPNRAEADRWIADAYETEGSLFKVREILAIDPSAPQQAQAAAQPEPSDHGGAWVVKYKFHRSLYVDSPLYWANGQMNFRTFEEARAWAGDRHPQLLGFTPLLVYYQPFVGGKLSNPGPTPAELARDSSTDACIVRGGRPF